MNSTTPWLILFAVAILLGLAGGIFLLHDMIYPPPKQTVAIRHDSITVKHVPVFIDTGRTVFVRKTRTVHDTLRDTVEVATFDSSYDVPVDIEVRSDTQFVAHRKTRVRIHAEYWKPPVDLFRNIGLYVFPLTVDLERRDTTFVLAAPRESWFHPWWNVNAGLNHPLGFAQVGLGKFNAAAVVQTGLSPTWTFGYGSGH